VQTEFLDDLLRQHARHFPGGEAVICGSRRVTYAELDRLVDALAIRLLEGNVARGDRVAVLCHPCLEFWSSFLAASRIGAIWVGINPKYRAEEIRHLLTDASPKLVLAEERDSDIGDSLPGLVCQLAAQPRYRLLEEVAVLGSEGLSAAENPGLKARISERSADDAAALVYTSGSSGKPKGALLSHKGLTRGARMQIRHLAVERQSLVVSFPINHVACLADTCATTLISAGKIVFHRRFDPKAILRATADERCNMLGGVPAMLQMMLDDPAFHEADLSAVELIAWGGAPMSSEYIARLQELGKRLMTLYGLTETSANIVFGDESGGIAALADSIGIEDESVRCRIVKEDGVVCEDGESGELQFYGDFFFSGYWGREGDSRAAWTEDGWFRSGDIGYRRADGRLALVGRRSDMFKSGGYNVYPREVELALESLPGVAAAAVVGVPDPLFQEVGLAWIVPEPGSEPDAGSLKAACADHLANYKVPKYFRFIAEMPLLPVGKIDKGALRARAMSDAPAQKPGTGV